MQISVLGDGGWGTALAQTLAGNGHKVLLWGAFPEYTQIIAESGENPKFLPGVKLHANIEPVAEIARAATGDVVVLASPTQFMRATLNAFAPHFEVRRHKLVNVAKGIEEKTLMRISEVTLDVLGPHSYCVLSGPSHAEEVARGVPTAITAAAQQPDDAKAVQALFMNGFLRVYTSSDIVGVELGGALKNVIALAAGIIDGMNLGDNPKAALLTRGIAEMGRLGEKLGGNAATFAGLSGIGDLFVTCSSRHSRNRHVGEELGRGKKLADITAAMNMSVAEGVRSAPGAYQLARRANVETPIINEIYSVLYDNKPPADAIAALMARDPKME